MLFQLPCLMLSDLFQIRILKVWILAHLVRLRGLGISQSQGFHLHRTIRLQEDADILTCQQRDSNPQFQCLNDFRPFGYPYEHFIIFMFKYFTQQYDTASLNNLRIKQTLVHSDCDYIVNCKAGVRLWPLLELHVNPLEFPASLWLTRTNFSSCIMIAFVSCILTRG